MNSPPNDEKSAKTRRGFGALSPEKHREFSARGGRNVDPTQRSFSQDRKLAASAGRKGGAQGHEPPAPPLAAEALPGRVAGKRVLVVEDDYLLAEDVASILVELGAEVVGPVASIQAAIGVLDSGPEIHGAVLDVRLGNELVFDLADELSERSIPYVFITAYARSSIPLRYASVPLFEKPLTVRQIAGRLLLRSPCS